MGAGPQDGDDGKTPGEEQDRAGRFGDRQKNQQGNRQEAWIEGIRVVADSNRIIAALIKDSTTRRILESPSFSFYAPEFMRSEVEKHREEISSKGKMGEGEFDLLFSLLLTRVKILPRANYQHLIECLKRDIPDQKDLPYLAVCTLVEADGIWTHDPHFLRQKRVKVLTN